MTRYTSWLYYATGIFMGFWNATLFVERGEELFIWQGALLAVATLIGLWTIIFIFTGLKRTGS